MQINLTFLVLGLVFFLKILSWLIIIRVIISWIAPQSHHPFVVFVVHTTEAIVSPVRNMIPKGNGAMAMIDWSPLIVLILIDVFRYALIRFFA